MAHVRQEFAFGPVGVLGLARRRFRASNGFLEVPVGILQLGSVVSDKTYAERLLLLQHGVKIALKNKLYHLMIGPFTAYSVLSAYLLQFEEAEKYIEHCIQQLDKPEQESFQKILKFWSKLGLELEK